MKSRRIPLESEVDKYEVGKGLVREAGIGAESRREDTEDAILLTIRIPKNRRVG